MKSPVRCLPGAWMVALVLWSACRTDAADESLLETQPGAPALALVCAADQTIGCNEAPIFGTPAVSGACGGPVQLTWVEASEAAPCPEGWSVRRTWTVVDGCGSTASCSQVITGADTTAPQLAVAPDITVGCSQGVTPDVTGGAVAVDACDPSLEITFMDEDEPLACPGLLRITRTWTARDGCGNFRTRVQRITVQDTRPPALACPADITLECGQSTAPAVTGEAVATDGCDPGVEATHTDVEEAVSCGPSKVIFRTWRAADACGNATACVQRITVLDRTAPVVVCPPDLTVDCDAELGETEPATATDGCGSTTVLRFTDRIEGGVCPAARVIMRRWIATDACGNAAHCEQRIVIVDQTPPVLSCPGDVTVECDEPVDPAATGWATATDNCDIAFPISYADAAVPGDCPQERMITRRWQTVDDCGNTAACEQRITVRDTTPPAVVCPPDLTVGCDSVPVPDPAAPGATDDCAGPVLREWLGDETVGETCPHRRVLLRSYRATDACGNSAVCVQRVTVEDRVPPAVVCPPDRAVECGDAWEFGRPTATDNCLGAVTLTVESTVTNQVEGNLFIATRTWVAQDVCGNAAGCQQTIRIVDTTPPMPLCPADVLVGCVDAEGARVEFAAGVTDACDGAAVIQCVPPSGGVLPLGATRVECRATDASGNAAVCSFQVRVADAEPPQVTCPRDIILAERPAASGGAVAVFEPAVASDGCDGAPVVVCEPRSGAWFGNGVTPVICTATDASGNAATCAFTVRVIGYMLAVNRTADAGAGTLRQALLDAQSAPGPNAIVFGLAGDPPFTIRLESPLPVIADEVILDGWSQVQFAGAPLIEIDGSGIDGSYAEAAEAGSAGSAAAGPAGLVLTSGGNVVRGLSLTAFETGLRVLGPGGNVIEGNYLGFGLAGGAGGNRGDGLVLASPNNQVGGAAPGTGNVIAGNLGSGIFLDGRFAVSNRIEGNFIGIGLEGAVLGNSANGVRLGTGAAGNRLGGVEPGAGNWIAFNGGIGVLLEGAAGSGNSILGNSIFANGGLGIDLGGDGLSPNDAGDVDAGPNGMMNAPELLAVIATGEGLTVEGRVNGVASAVYRLEFFVSDALGEAGLAQGQRRIGEATAVTGPEGVEPFAVALAVSVRPDQWITATGTDGQGNTSEFSTALQAAAAPVILAPPEDAMVLPGEPVTFCVTAGGSEPLEYQWRHNGVNLLGATGPCHTIPAVELSDGGSYAVVVRNDYGAVVSPAATLVLQVTVLQAGDNFAERVEIGGLTGMAAGNNAGATREPGEPKPAGKPGGQSVWYTWRAPATGIATFGTTGSTFDTLLGVYTGTVVSNLAVQASDEDSGGFYTSGIRFNAIAGTQYHVAIDGFGGVGGRFVLQWHLETTDALLPLIRTQPVGQTVPPGATATFTVSAVPVCKYTYYKGGKYADKCGCGDRLTYQWRFNGQPLPGATRPTLVIDNARPEVVGNYSVRISDGSRAVDSLTVSLQLNETGFTYQEVQATDKFLDAALTQDPLRIGGPVGPAAGFAVVSGFTGTQVFNTAGSATELGEEPICGVVGGASQWLSFVPGEAGSLFLNTDGSSFDTVLAVLTRSPDNPERLEVVGCDNNGGSDGRDSALVVPVQAGQTNFIVVDGVNGATGILRLNFSLVTPARLTAVGKAETGANQLRLTGRPAMRFTLESSVDLTRWVALVSSNAPSGTFDYLDRVPKNDRPRFYRALMLP